MSNKKGATLNLIDSVAQTLIDRGIAKKVKEVGRPPKDKMIKRAKNK